MLLRAATTLALCLTVTIHGQKLMTPPEFQAIPAAKADARLQYGPTKTHIGDIRVPTNKPGPHPVAVLIHGGCFQAKFANLNELSQLGEALRRDGIATWNIEYRALGQPGGGWPGTYQDIGLAIDHLRTLASRYRLDLSKVIVIGHSAGGHLANWSASRAKLPAAGPLSAPSPIKPVGIVNLAGLPDLREHTKAYEQACDGPVIHQMLGGDPAIVKANGIAASPVERLPLGVKQTIILGDQEDFVPRPIAQAYIAKAKAAGDDAKLVIIPAAGHFEIAASTTKAWPKVREAILALLKP